MEGIEGHFLTEFIKACKKAASFGLVRCSSGNMSVRCGDGRMLISASRSWMDELDSSQVSMCDINSGQCIAGPRPSVETVFHAGILRDRPEVNVVLHFQSDSATVLACSHRSVNYNIIPEIPYYIGSIGQVEYLPPGSPELAESVIQQMKSHNLTQLANHGQVVVGSDYNDAIQNAVFFELACKLILKAGDNARMLTDEAAIALRQARLDSGAV